MGTFRIEIEAVGGHGCEREIQDGAKVDGCGKYPCPDCSTRDLVDKFRHLGMTVNSATLTHWPGEKGEVKDDLVTGIRKGNF